MIVYCSIPAITRRDKTLSEINDQICLPHVTMNYHRVHDVYMNEVRQADCLIVMHKNNEFDFMLESLTHTGQEDVLEARRLGKKIFLAYRTSGGAISIYETVSSDHHMRGMPGSTRRIAEYLRENAPKKQVAQIGKAVDTSQYYDEGYPFMPEPSRFDKVIAAEYDILAGIAAELDEKVISTIDLRKFKYDRRLLI